MALSSSMSSSAKMSEFLHCPNCHYPIAQADRENRYYYGSNQIKSNHPYERSMRPTSQGASMNVSVSQNGQSQYLPDLNDRQNQPGNPHEKGKSLFSFSLPKRLKRSPRQSNSRPPHRPARPSPAQCPPDIPGFSGIKGRLKSSISAPFLSAEQQAYAIGPNGMSYSDNSARKQAVKPPETRSRRSQISNDSFTREHGYDDENATYVRRPILGGSDVRSNTPSNQPLLYSTPPTTASKIALRPSPLHLEQDVPSIPLNKPRFRTSFDSNSLDTAPPQISLPRIFKRDSYVSDRSIYSNNTQLHDLSLLETPPTSPPPLPQRNARRKTVTPDGARQLALRMRDELEIMKDIHNMTSTEKEAKRRTRIIQSQNGAHRSDGDYASEFQARASIEGISSSQSNGSEDEMFVRAIEKAIRGSLEFQEWLSCRQLAPHDATHDQASPSRITRLSPVSAASSASSGVLPRSSRKISEPALLKPVIQSGPSCDLSSKPNTTQRVRRDSVSPVSLVKMRRKLYEVSDDGKSEPEAQYSASPPPSLVRTSRSSTSTVELPLNCRRISIEWKGKRVPILIHENGKVFEGPCTDSSCLQHGSRLAGEML